MITRLLLLSVICLPVFACAQSLSSGQEMLQDEERANPDINKPRPIAARETVFMNEMTWMEVRDAIRSGYRTAIVMTGGIEMNGPYMVTDKHNIVCRVVGERLARKLGNALIATIVPYVPQGDVNPPSGHMRYPGTIGVSEDTFQSLLIDIVTGLKTQGFKDIILIGDSGGNQSGMQAVAEQMSPTWKTGRVTYIPEFYGYEKWIAWEEERGIYEKNDGIHDTFRDTAILMLEDPEYVRRKARLGKGLFTINGVDLEPLAETLQVANQLVDYQVQLTVDAIQRKLVYDR
ncbi:MAG: creatininase family protein [Cyclobacteriaceae bacterium]|nr:creatininase family protein [Cyclobacteriaceae bacterium HetDA_MAG_MS6]